MVHKSHIKVFLICLKFINYLVVTHLNTLCKRTNEVVQTSNIFKINI